MKEIKKINKSFIIGIIVIVIGIMIGIIPILLNNKEQKEDNNKMENYIKRTSIKEDNKEEETIKNNQNDNKTSKKEEYLLILEIPTIKLKKGVYPLNSKLNTIKKNVQIMDKSSLPYVENGNLILEAHNGTSKVSYFKNLDKLKIGDIANIYYDGIKYSYKIYNIYDVSKDGEVEVYRDNKKTTLTLITCKKNTKDRQLVIILYLDSKEEY